MLKAPGSTTSMLSLFRFKTAFCRYNFINLYVLQVKLNLQVNSLPNQVSLSQPRSIICFNLYQFEAGKKLVACGLWPVTCAFYVPQADLGWNELIKVETSWSTILAKNNGKNFYIYLKLSLSAPLFLPPSQFCYAVQSKGSQLLLTLWGGGGRSTNDNERLNTVMATDYRCQK